MSNNTGLLSRPIKNTCNFNAVGNPIVYKLRREDAGATQVNDDSGFAQLQFNGVDLTGYFQVDDSVYSVLGVGIITASVFSGGNTLITLDIAYTANTPSYVNNLSKRTDYKVEVEVFDADTDVALGPRLAYDFDQTGTTYADISGIVRAYLKSEWASVFVSIAEEFTSIKVYIKYQEFYNQTYWEIISEVASPIAAVFAVVNLLQFSPPNFVRYAHGGNLLGYFPQVTTSKWLTKFSRATIWRGYPFTVSVLWSIGPMTLRVKQYNSEGTEIANAVSFLNHEVGTVVRVDLTSYPLATADKMIISMENGSDILLEEFTLDARDPCENPVLLFWKNSLGGDAFWLFDESQDYSYVNSAGNKVRRMILYADNLTVDQWDALNELNSISEIFQLNIVDYGMDNSIDKTHYRDDNQVYIISATGEKLGVIMVNTENKTRTLNKKHQIQLTIELPALYTV